MWNTKICPNLCIQLSQPLWQKFVSLPCSLSPGQTDQEEADKNHAEPDLDAVHIGYTGRVCSARGFSDIWKTGLSVLVLFFVFYVFFFPFLWGRAAREGPPSVIVSESKLLRAWGLAVAKRDGKLANGMMTLAELMLICTHTNTRFKIQTLAAHPQVNVWKRPQEI